MSLQARDHIQDLNDNISFLQSLILIKVQFWFKSDLTLEQQAEGFRIIKGVS